jgi:hypothetical protein
MSRGGSDVPALVTFRQIPEFCLSKFENHSSFEMASAIKFDATSLEVFFDKALTNAASSLRCILANNGANAVQAAAHH